MKTLICTRRQRGAPEEAVAKLLRQGVPGAVIDDELPWDELRIKNGGFEGACQQVVVDFDQVILVPHDGSMIARGQATIANMALSRGKPVQVASNHDGDYYRISRLSIVDADDWGGSYATVQTGE